MIVLDTNIISEFQNREPDEAVAHWLRLTPQNELSTCAPVFNELLYGAFLRLKRSGSDTLVSAHRKFIDKHNLIDITLLSDEGAKLATALGAKHPKLPVANRFYMVVDQQQRIIFEKNTGFALLEDQTETLLGIIDEHIE